MSHTPTASDRTDRALGMLLRVGVYLSLIITILGIVLLVAREPQSLGDPAHTAQFVRTGPDHPYPPAAVLKGIAAGDGPSIIMLGILLLILTPVLRVFASVIAFLLQKDLLYAAITAAVLIILTLAFILGKTH